MVIRALRPWLDVAAVYAVIIGLSSLPGEALSGTPGWSAVLGHAAGYALLAVTLHRAVGGRSAGFAAIVLAVLLGVLNEIQQGTVVGRSPDVTDVAVDGLGALAGVALRGAWTRRRRTSAGSAALVRRRGPGSRPPVRGSAAPR